MKTLLKLVLSALFVVACYLALIFFTLNTEAQALDTVKNTSDKQMNVITRHREVVSNKTIYQLVLQEHEESELITVYVDATTYVNLGRGSKVLVPHDF